MRYLKPLLFSVLSVSSLNALYAQTVIVKNITNNTTSDFIVISGDNVLEKKLINAPQSEINSFLQSRVDQFIVPSGTTKPFNKQINFVNSMGDKRLFFINNNTKTPQYELIAGLSLSNQARIILVDIQLRLNKPNSLSGVTQSLSYSVQNQYTLDITIGNTLDTSTITLDKF